MVYLLLQERALPCPVCYSCSLGRELPCPVCYSCSWVRRTTLPCHQLLLLGEEDYPAQTPVSLLVLLLTRPSVSTSGYRSIRVLRMVAHKLGVGREGGGPGGGCSIPSLESWRLYQQIPVKDFPVLGAPRTLLVEQPQPSCPQLRRKHVLGSGASISLGKVVQEAPPPKVVTLHRGS